MPLASSPRTCECSQAGKRPLIEDQLRPRLEGLTDEEYLWEPVADTWSLRAKGDSVAPVQGGAGDLVIEFAFPVPDPAPVTTIAWRLEHVVVGCFGARTHSPGPRCPWRGDERNRYGSLPGREGSGLVGRS